MFHENCKDAHVFLLKWKSSDHGWSSPFTLQPDASENKRNPAKQSDNLHTFMVKYLTLYHIYSSRHKVTYCTSLKVFVPVISEVADASDKHVTSGGQDERKQSTLIERVIHHRLSLPLPLEGWLLAGKTAADVPTPEAKRICGYSTRKTTLRAVKLWECCVRVLDPFIKVALKIL